MLRQSVLLFLRCANQSVAQILLLRVDKLERLSLIILANLVLNKQSNKWCL